MCPSTDAVEPLRSRGIGRSRTSTHSQQFLHCHRFPMTSLSESLLCSHTISATYSQMLTCSKFIIVALCLAVLVTPCSANSGGRLSSRTVTTKYGALKGSIVSPEGGLRHSLQPVEVFLGVPYASAPIGAMRFMPPGTPTHWKGIRMADRPAPVCPQRPPFVHNETDALRRMPAGRLEHLRRLLPHLQKQSEDCLYLNIYTPAVGKFATQLIRKARTEKIKL